MTGRVRFLCKLTGSTGHKINLALKDLVLEVLLSSSSNLYVHLDSQVNSLKLKTVKAYYDHRNRMGPENTHLRCERYKYRITITSIVWGTRIYHLTSMSNLRAQLSRMRPSLRACAAKLVNQTQGTQYLL